ncbi:hypothetical protein TWF694_009074 [Orbilia ellipsospora]|uniref:DOMON domain-containing protein n=1 Tax=Orbilia ellipsospora TaxID=2528407 RepID=A0AAV9XDS7_9PEZI
MRLRIAAVLASLAHLAQAQFSRFTPPDDSTVTYSVNVPSLTSSSGSGAIFFQVKAPASGKQWVALGIGSGMVGAHIFVIYTDGTGNVTVSARTGTGHVEPEYNPDAKVTLLEGSGIVGNNLIANVRCDNCIDLAGLDITSKASSWVWAIKNGDGLDSSSPSAEIIQHDTMGVFAYDLTKATGGNSANPFVASNSPSSSSTRAAGTSGGATPTGSSAPSSSPTSSSDSSDDDDTGSGSVSIGFDFSVIPKWQKTHAILMGTAFAVLFPLGAIILRVLPSGQKVHLHMIIQGSAFIIAIAGLGYGVMLGKNLQLLHETHAIIGMVVMGGMFFQPILGLIHHWLFKVKGKRTILAFIHANWGRALMILGIINGGLGLELANNTHNGKIAYSVVAGVMGAAWFAASAFYYIRGGSQQNPPPKRRDSAE